MFNFLHIQNIVFILFGVTLFFEVLIGLGLLISFVLPAHRLWPPPKKRSWQFVYIHLLTESSISLYFVLGFLDLNTFFFTHWIHFFFGSISIAAGAIIFVWALGTLTISTSLGLKQRIVNKGPYRYSRNPQYIGIVLFLIGTMLIYNSFYAFAAGSIGVVLFLFTTFVEEPWLKENFGEEYENYREKVPRFILTLKI
jgi:protein-S-isoprenylcysteine O-methyltransferase Ste14